MAIKRERVLIDSGQMLRAAFMVEGGQGLFSVFFESRGGSRKNGTERNPDYSTALGEVLGRLKGCDAAITDVLVESRLAKKHLSPDERTLNLSMPYPILLNQLKDLGPLKSELQSKQLHVGSIPPQKTSSNSTRRLRINVSIHDKSLAAEDLAELLAGTAPKRSGISATSREGQVFTVAKLHYVNGVVYHTAEHLDSDLEHLALNYSETTKSGNVKHPLVRVRTLVRLAVGLGLLNLEKQTVKITQLGQAYYEARGDDKWTLTEKQQKILCDHILSDPYRSDTIYAITALFKLYKAGYLGEELSGQYAIEIGKGDAWKSPVTYEGFTKFGLSYIAELGLMDVQEDELLIKSFVVERHYQDKVNIVKAIQLPSGKLPKPKAKAASTTERYPSNPRVSKSALVSAAFKCELNPSHTTFLNHISKQQHMEAHHLIPMKYQDDFENALDVPENILSLCPNCHRKIHLADNFERIIVVEQAHELKKKALPYRGLSVSITELLTFYGIHD